MLAFAWRMVGIGNSGNTLSMVRIILVGEAAEARISTSDDAKWASTTRVDDERQQVLDGEYIDSFRFKAVYNNRPPTQEGGYHYQVGDCPSH